MIDTVDEREITALLLRYATGIDRRDWKLFRTCFADDFEGDYPGFGLWRGPDEITAFMTRAHTSLGATLHRMSNFVINGTGDAATAHSYVDALLTSATLGEAPHRAAGWYDDQFVRTVQGWKLSRRRFIQVHLGYLDLLETVS
jgi:hypothetical protein